MAMTAPRDGRASADEWNESRRAELSKQIASARLTVGEACARHGLDAELVQDWLRDFRRSAVSAFDAQLKQTLVDQGADVALGAAEFSGTLEEISVIDWIQSVELTRKSAVIVVSHDSPDNSSPDSRGPDSRGPERRAAGARRLESRVWCANGAVVDAESGRLRGEAALHRIVSLERGRVLVEFRVVRRSRTIFTSTPSLLLQAAHRKDEAARFWRKLGDGRRAYRVTEKAARRAGYSSQAERRLLEAFQQPRSLLQVFEHSELGDVETLTLLAQLSESQLIAADPSSTPLPLPEADTGDLAASSRTLTTLAIAPRREAFPRWILPAWAWSGLGALALVTIVALSRPEASPRSQAAPEPELETAPASAKLALTPAQPVPSQPVPELPLVQAPADAESYVVATAFEPSDAAIWLDGQPVSSAGLDTTLPKDGRAHELRAVAPGYAPALVVFVDAPPPDRIRLEALPAAPAEPSLSDAVPAAGPVPIQAELVVLRAKPAREGGRRGARARAAERAKKAPSIQTIEAATPTIRVIP